MKLATRANGAELMDEPRLEPSEIRVALQDLEGVNRWLGGWRVLRSAMASLLADVPPGSYTVLDVGTGGGDLVILLSRWGWSRGYFLRILATDIHPQTLELARSRTRDEPNISVALADALSLPFRAGSFDFAVCSTMLHHFGSEAAVGVLSELARVSRRGLAINDLRRSQVAYWGARALAATLWRRSRLTRHDGPLSVRRAFTPSELAAAAAAAGLTGFRIRTHLPFRLSLTAASSAVDGG